MGDKALISPSNSSAGVINTSWHVSSPWLIPQCSIHLHNVTLCGEDVLQGMFIDNIVCVEKLMKKKEQKMQVPAVTVR